MLAPYHCQQVSFPKVYFLEVHASEVTVGYYSRNGELPAAKVRNELNAAKCFWAHEVSTAALEAARSLQK